MTQPIFLVGISNCRQWVIIVVAEHSYLVSRASSITASTGSLTCHLTNINQDTTADTVRTKRSQLQPVTTWPLLFRPFEVVLQASERDSIS